MKQQHRCLVEIALAEWHETVHIFELSKLILHQTHLFQNLYSASASYNTSKAIRSSTHTYSSCFV